MRVPSFRFGVFAFLRLRSVPKVTPFNFAPHGEAGRPISFLADLGGDRSWCICGACGLEAI